MTQRILTAFDTLDLYSEKVLANHGKKRQLGDIPIQISLCTPLTSDDESELSLPRSTKSNILSLPMHLSEEYPHFNLRRMRSEKCESAVTSAVSSQSCSKQLIRPFSAFEKSSNLKDNALYAADANISAEKSKKNLTSPRCKSASFRKPRWTTEVKKVSHLIPSWQENSCAHIGTALEYTDTSHWYTFTGVNIRRDDIPFIAFADGKENEYSIDETEEKEVVQHLQTNNKIHGGRNGHLQQKMPESKNRRNESTLFGEDASRAEEVQDLKYDYFINNLKSKGSLKLVPLSMEDELGRPDVKILSPKAQKAEYSSLILNETYPATFHDDNSKHKLLKPGTEFHQHLQQSNNCLERTIKRETERYAARRVVDDDNIDNTKETVENASKVYVREFKKSKTLQRKTSGKQKVSVHILFADGSRQPLQLKDFRNRSTNKSIDNAFENELPVNKTFLKALSTYGIKSTGSPDNRPATTGINLHVGVDCDTFSNGTRSKFTMSKACHPTGYQIAIPSSSTLQRQKIIISERQLWRNYIPIAKPIKLQESEKSLHSKKSDIATCNPTVNQVLISQRHTDCVPLNPQNISLLEVPERSTPGNLIHYTDKSPFNTNTHTRFMESNDVTDKYSLHLNTLSMKDGASSPSSETSSQPSSPPSALQNKVLESETAKRPDWPNEVACLQNPAPLPTPAPENIRPVINIPTASFDPLSLADLEE